MSQGLNNSSSVIFITLIKKDQLFLLSVKNCINLFFQKVETLKPGTNTVVETYSVTGIEINPGLINNPSIVGSPMNLNMYVDYTIKFTPMNSLPDNGYIEIWFPVEYTGLIVKK